VLGAIAGDIVGSPFEGGPAPPQGFELFHPACRFTDDSVCCLAVAEAILTNGDFASTLRQFVRRHPERGYGGMFFRWAFDDDAGSYGSWGNGAPMRVAAVGWLAGDLQEALAFAAEQACVSHDHPDAVAAAQAVAHAIYAIRQGRPVADVREEVGAAYCYDLAAPPSGGGFDVSAAGTAPNALRAAFASQSWEQAGRIAIGLGGDTDTLACIAGGVAEAMHGLPGHVRKAARDYLTDDLRAVLDRFEQRVMGAASAS
jgi:ADP-ribosyl-[dinitrogen reductase] hydrolase